MELKDVDDYTDALEYAGAEIHAYEEFGSYQGEWWALVTYNGETGWINGDYGSCSGCDAFEASFSWGRDKTDKAVRDFAKDYLDTMMGQNEAEARAAKYSSWDLEADKMVAFIKTNKMQTTV